MLLFPELGPCPADRAGRFPYLSRLKVAAATLVAFITPCRGVAVGTNALDITVGQEPFTPGAITLVDSLWIDEPLFDEAAHDGPCPVMVCRVVGHSEVIEYYVDLPEGFMEMLVVFLCKAPRGDPCLLGTYDDGRAVVIRAADEHHRFTSPTQVPDIEIGRDISTEMPEVTGAVCIGKPTGYEQWWIDHYTISSN